MFDFVDKTFNQMALRIFKPIHLARLGSASASRDDGLHVPRINGLERRLAVVAPVADEYLGAFRHQRNQSLSLSGVMDLPPNKYKVEGFTQGIGDGVDMDLSDAPAPRAAQRPGHDVSRRSPVPAGVGADYPNPCAVPSIRHCGTSAESACRQGSTCHARWAAVAIAPPISAPKALVHQKGPASFRRHADRLVDDQYQVNRLPFLVADVEPVRYRRKALTLATAEAYINVHLYSIVILHK